MASSNCLSLVLSPETVMLLLTCDQFPGQQYRKGKIIWIIFLGLLKRREGGGSWLECSYRQVIAIWISYYVNSASEEIEQQWSRVQENCSFTIAKYSSSSSTRDIIFIPISSWRAINFNFSLFLHHNISRVLSWTRVVFYPEVVCYYLFNNITWI